MSEYVANVAPPIYGERERSLLRENGHLRGKVSELTSQLELWRCGYRLLKGLFHQVPGERDMVCFKAWELVDGNLGDVGHKQEDGK